MLTTDAFFASSWRKHSIFPHPDSGVLTKQSFGVPPPKFHDLAVSSPIRRGRCHSRSSLRVHTVPSMHPPLVLAISRGILKSLLPSPVWTRRFACDNLSSRSSPQAFVTKRQVNMDDKIFASARMTAALDEDQTAYEAIPSVNIFDSGADFSRPGSTFIQAPPRRRPRASRWLSRWLILVPLLVAIGFLVMGCQSGY